MREKLLRRRLALVKICGGFDAAFARFGRDYPPFDPAKFGAST
jgi:hypothetical protein